MKNKDSKQLPLFVLEDKNHLVQDAQYQSKPQADSPYSQYIVYVDEKARSIFLETAQPSINVI
ncbi:MAG: hypothetical protein QS721_06590 [Candidatus Endonucleobacter sp. (ex Gigantidas childressi)]|nr:hypothetical protein [Candidatus Endonucleobacter sp. (ex Gigantidas childressi)]